MGQGNLSKELRIAVLEAGSEWKPRVHALYDKFRKGKELIEGERLLVFWKAFGTAVGLEFSAEAVRDTYMKEADLDGDGKLSLDEMEKFLRKKFKLFKDAENRK